MSSAPAEPFDTSSLSTVERQFRRRPSVYTPNAIPMDNRFIAFLISASGMGRSDRVLEVACGTGGATIAFAERCGAAVGLDVRADALARARTEALERNIPNASFVAGEIERMPLAGGSFTGALCRFSFHHFVHPERVFAEMARVVAPTGWMVVSDMTASENAEEAEFHNQMERLCDPTHARTLAASEFERIFADNGFRITMKIARDSRITLDDWLCFGAPPPENTARLREMVESSAGLDQPGLKLIRDRGTIRLLHTSVSFVIERDG
jgi:ubiquinone/menaquinone biosynthesis C-methylase UbiE